MIIALASPRVASTLDDGLERIARLQSEAAARGARIVCFPEAYLPGLRGQDFDVLHWDERVQADALAAVARSAQAHGIATIMGFEHLSEPGRQIAAAMIDAEGRVQGIQTKNQIDPSEDAHYVPGTTRRLFQIEGLTFGIAICHEGWRYPETVRWAAARGAQVVFHPQHTGTEVVGVARRTWGEVNAPYYERAMMMRSIENTIYFASVNYALRFQQSATSVIGPDGTCEAHLPYGEEGVLVHTLDLAKATGLLAQRYAPERYVEGASGRS